MCVTTGTHEKVSPAVNTCRRGLEFETPGVEEIKEAADGFQLELKRVLSINHSIQTSGACLNHSINSNGCFASYYPNTPRRKAWREETKKHTYPHTNMGGTTHQNR